MEEKPLSEKESLELITGMISKARNHYHESGTSALLWGFANMICFVLAYFKVEDFGFGIPFNPFWLLGITALFQIYFSKKEKVSKATVTYMDEAHRYVWIAFGITISILTIAGGFADIGYIVLPMLLLIFGIPTFISGAIKKFNPLVIGGIICWILSVVCMFYRGSGVYLLVALGACCAWVIPGLILRKEFHKNMDKLRNGI